MVTPDNLQSNMNFLGIGDSDEKPAGYWTEAIRAKYPVTAKMNCYDVDAVVRNVQNDIDALYANNALSISNATRRGNNAMIADYSVYLNEVKSYYNRMLCDKQLTDEQQQEDLQANIGLLNQAQDLTKNVDRTATYVIIGMITIVVIVSGVMIFKKVKKP